MKIPKYLLQSLLIVSAVLGMTHLASAAPATDTWTGNTGANWSSPGNWTGGNAPPQAGDALVFGSSGQTTLNNDLTAGTAFDGITFSGGNAFTLNGNSVLLSETNVLTFGNLSTIGIYNQSGLTQTFGMPVNLDWGGYIFSSPSGGSIALNGGLTPNLGGVAFFDTAVTSSSLTLDGTTGLITGLEGAGLMYSGNPIGLATISGGSIQAYAGYTPVASGAIGDGNNINLTATGATGTYSAVNNTVNTISAAQAGTQTTTLTIGAGNTLTLGQQGGIYALAASSNPNALTVAAGAGGSLTAGTTAGASIVFGTHGSAAGNSPPNVMTVSSVIKNNLGGAVSVVKVGNSSMVLSGANTYSGGTYLLQGQIQTGNVAALGTGPLYVAPGATAFLNSGNATYANDLYISPGTGSSLWNATGLNPGALMLPTPGSGTTVFSGKLTLLGAPVSAATYPPTAGCRMTGDKDATETYTFTGQITGTGTLDLNCSPHAENIILNNQTVNANNWQGGLIIEESLGLPSSARNIFVKLGANNQIPSGASAGDVTLYNADASAQHSLVRLDLNGFNASINGLNASATSSTLPQVVDLGTANSTLTFGGNNASGTFNATTSDNGVGKALSLVKTGSGTETFQGALNHNGNTTVNGGILALTGSATMPNTPVITVASGATLDASGLGGLTVGAAQTLNCVGTVIGSATVNGTVQSLDAIGTLTDTGNMTFNSGGSYIWDVNNVTGTAGADPGWSLLNISGQLQLGSLGASSFTINVTSLTAGDVAGNAANFNSSSSYSWPIAYAAGGISGFSSSQFNILTTGFANYPNSSSQWSVSLDNTGNYLMLNFSGFQVITTQLPASVMVNQGQNAVFTVTVNPLGTGTTFAWTQNGNPLSNGGTSAGGNPGNVSIVTSGGGNTSTLTISGVDAAFATGDNGPISVTVNTTFNGAKQATSTATLTVVDPPYNPNVTSSQTVPPVSAGSVNVLTATASGTSPFTYQWYQNGNAIGGATGSSFNLNVSGSSAGSYTVVISNPAGNVTSSSTVIGPISVVPNQIVFEPFNYVTQPTTQSSGNPWTATAAGELNVAGLPQVVSYIYNQATGTGLLWQQEGTVGQEWTLAQDMRIEPGYTGGYSNYVLNVNSPAGDYYPWPGLAGNEPNEMACNSAGTTVVLPLGTGGSISSGSIYFSLIMHVDQGSPITQVGQTYFCGFGTGAANGTSFNGSIYVNLQGNDTYIPGVFKVAAGQSALNAGVNGNWSGKAYHRGEIVFAVCRVTINPGANNDTCDLWLDPNPSTFYASEANLPPPDVSAVGAGAPDVGNVDSFYFKSSMAPASRRFTDLRIGTTWASVTPPSAPTLSLANQVLGLGQTTVVFASQNAGNPVGTYQWQFNGGPALVDNAHYSGTGTGTLTISNPTGADLGVYTVTGMNSDPSGPLENGATLTGSASATLTAAPIPSIVYSAPNVIVYWPTSYTGWTLQHTASLNPSSWTTAGLPAPVVVGPNNTVTVNAAATGAQFFRLKH